LFLLPKECISAKFCLRGGLEFGAPDCPIISAVRVPQAQLVQLNFTEGREPPTASQMPIHGQSGTHNPDAQSTRCVKIPNQEIRTALWADALLRLERSPPLAAPSVPAKRTSPTWLTSADLSAYVTECGQYVVGDANHMKNTPPPLHKHAASQENYSQMGSCA
jgi:hypothetical protein